MKNEILEKVEFANNELTRVRFFIVNKDTGSRQLAELSVPANFEKGKNRYWDKILEQHTVSELKDKRRKLIQLSKAQAEANKKKQKTTKESIDLRELFRYKALYMKLPFVVTDEQKSLIRKAPNRFCLDAMVFKFMHDYINSNNPDIEDLYDEIEDIFYENE